ncbi:MAG TPA: hypothetical protein VIH61_09470, partial [Waddliaceae bacterium]
AINFFTTNGYLDTNGNFSFSERFTGILSGTTINGNIMQAQYRCGQQYGLIPRTMLTWNDTIAAKYPNQAAMDEAYYNPSSITQAMLDMGKQWLTYVNLSWGWIGDGTTPIPLATLALGCQTSCLGSAIPLPSPINLYNESLVPYTGSTTVEHCITLDFVDLTPNDPYPLWGTDQYLPQVRQWASNYDFPITIAHFVEMIK